MDCCKKEEDCCPCADRIECLQAQINQLKGENGIRRIEISLLIQLLFNEDFTPEDEPAAIILNKARNRELKIEPIN